MLALKVQNFPASFYRALLFKEINTVEKWRQPLSLLKYKICSAFLSTRMVISLYSTFHAFAYMKFSLVKDTSNNAACSQSCWKNPSYYIINISKSQLPELLMHIEWSTCTVECTCL